MRPKRLRRDLLVRLMLPLLAIVAITGGIGYYTSLHFVDQVFDRWLLDSARALANQVRVDADHVHVDLPDAAAAILAYDELDATYFSVVRGADHIAGYLGIPTRGEHNVTYPLGTAYDATLSGRRVRVAAVRLDEGNGAGSVTVRVAETNNKRDRAQREEFYELAPLVILLLATALAIDYAVRHTTRPLESIAARWSEQSHASLAPIETTDVPVELAPFAVALNNLLARIRALLMRERQFVSTAAHQLRTPLTALQLGLARAARAPDLETTRHVLGELEANTQRTARLLQQLLALGRIDPEARAALEFSPTDLVELAREVGAAYLDVALHKSINLELRAPAQAVVVELYPDLFGEALGNLLDNALRYTPPGGSVFIEVDPEPPAVRILDSGPGIDEDERERVFERFARGHRAEGTTAGAGLGLAIVREIVALHGAVVSIGRARLGGAELCIRFRATR